MATADASGLPVAIDIQSASPHEVKLVESTIESRFVSKPPERIIGDKAYDSDPLDKCLLEQYGTELIAPHNRNRKKTQSPGWSGFETLSTQMESGAPVLLVA